MRGAWGEGGEPSGLMVRAAVLLLVGGAAVAGASACSPLEALPASFTSAGGSGGQGGSSAQGTLVIDVLTTSLGGLAEPAPAVGAVVAFDLPSGERVEQTVGADGRVTFESVDWSAPGAGVVTAYLEGRLPSSVLGLTPETVQGFAERGGTEVLTVYLAPASGEFVAVSGIAANMEDDGNYLFVSATAPGSRGDGYGPGWAAHVQVGEEFTLVATELALPASSTVSARGAEYVWLKWAGLDHQAVTSATPGVAFDLEASLPTSQVSGSFAIPDHGISDFFEQARGFAQVSSFESGLDAFLGCLSRLDVSADGSRFEYDLPHVSPPVVSLPVTVVQAYRDDEASWLILPGYPTVGAQPGVLPEPVRMTASEPVIEYGEPIEWLMNEVDEADPKLQMWSRVANSFTGATVWALRMPPGTTEMALPALPPNAEPNTVLGAGPLSAVIGHCEPTPAPEQYRGCKRVSQSVAVRILR